jgi:hypothetical protein
LVNRTISLLSEALSAQKQLRRFSAIDCYPQSHVENFLNSSASAFAGDFLAAPVCTPEPLKHFFGSYQEEQTKNCQHFLFQKIRFKLGLTIKQHSFHCEIGKRFAG